MARAYFLNNKTSPVKSWAALSMGFDDFTGVTLPVLDVYTEQDHPPVLNLVDAHKQSLSHPASMQQMLPGTGHFYDGKEQELLSLVRNWLDKTL